MKESNHLEYTDYNTMWKVILLEKFLSSIESSEISFWGRKSKFDEIKKTISKHFGYDIADDMFNPREVIDNFEKQRNVTRYLNDELSTSSGKNATNSAKASAKIGFEKKIGESTGNTLKKIYQGYTDTWKEAINAFIKTLKGVKFRFNHYLFVDGLDVRPPNIDANEYSECIGALVRAVHEINNQIFGNMTDEESHDLKIIGLTRTDIFLNSNLVNVTSCIRDNCVELDWSYSAERDFPISELYKMTNQILGWDGKSETAPLESYFNFKIDTGRSKSIKAYMYVQRQTRMRPRDIVALLRIIQDECVKNNISNPNKDVITSSQVRSDYSQYYLDQVESELVFKYTTEQIGLIRDFLRLMNKSMFEYEFIERYNHFCYNNDSFADMFPSHRELIDLLYSLDVIGWRECARKRCKDRDNRNDRYYDASFGTFKLTEVVHWHYRETNARTETYRFPWGPYEFAVTFAEKMSQIPGINLNEVYPNFLVHNGTKHYVSI